MAVCTMLFHGQMGSNPSDHGIIYNL